MSFIDLPIDHVYEETGQQFKMYPYYVSSGNLLSVSFGQSKKSARINLNQFLQLLAVDAFHQLSFRVRAKPNGQDYPTAPPRLSPRRSQVKPESSIAKELNDVYEQLMIEGFDKDLFLIAKKYGFETQIQRLLSKNKSDIKTYQEKSAGSLRHSLELEAQTIDKELVGFLGYDKDVIAKRRIGQSRFRDELIKNMKGCGISGLVAENLLVASHIVPWSQSSTHEKTDIDNGLLLSVTWDALFDRKLMYINQNGSIVFSSILSTNVLDILGIDKNAKLDERYLTDGRKAYLARHADATAKNWQS